MSDFEEDYSVLSHLVISKPPDTLSQRLLENSFKANEKKIKLGAAFFIVNCTVTCCSLTNSGTSPPEF